MLYAIYERRPLEESSCDKEACSAIHHFLCDAGAGAHGRMVSGAEISQTSEAPSA